MHGIVPYRDEDAGDVSALMDQIAELPSTSAESFRAFAALPFNRSARDFRLLRVEDRTVGFATSTLLHDGALPIRHFRIGIHPEHRRRRLGTLLLMEILRQDAPAGTLLQCNSQQSWQAGNAFLEHAGFRVSRVERLMRRAVRGTEAFAPPGFRLRPATARDDAAWIALHAEAYGAREDFTKLTPEHLHSERGCPGFDLRVAERDGDVVGYCHAMHLEGREALIQSLVVRSDVRGRGLGAALLSSSLRALASSSFDTASLNVVSTEHAAISVYERLGFETYDQMLTFQQPLSAARSTS
ncbi:GNAT family N-acetyltransferase [Pendulispora albinea]|uniref:GNAT family N-acetyltransferase n=1 Tax=Pendulispora albinea TaxID=2741071 RepID=A0ABZ2LKC0_9BACT